jgi:hypothetical protein
LDALTRNTGGRFAQLAERLFRQENILVMSAFDAVDGSSTGT